MFTNLFRGKDWDLKGTVVDYYDGSENDGNLV